ncbi:MAG: Gfo/Idh/MocA family oxidoreductase [Thermoguttaceae bacterium]|jgi:predicted dehydrogenase|nr:Gfo/Idh/MocA family oxidoreductase [Thermoguttaceae bacterium]
MTEKITRRTFTKATAAATLGLTAASARRVLGANDRIRLGFIGVGNRGSQLLAAFLKHEHAQVVVLSDVSQPLLAKAAEMVDDKVDREADFRKVIQRNDIDAVVIATPDHWHAIQTIDACNAGKDVYVEKPLSITVYEGRRMVEAARRNNRVVQVGIHRRSSKLHAQLAEMIADGKLGKVTVSRAYRLSNMYPDGIGKKPVTTPPPDLDWDLWLGPRPEQPYQENIAPYNFRWWNLYSSQMANWGVHRLDAIRWLTGELAPSSIVSMGGRFAVDDDRTIPDTQESVFEFASGRLAIFGMYEASGNPAIRYGEVELRGTQGTAYIDGWKFEIVPERGGQFQDREPRMEPMEVQSTDANLTWQHAGEFLDCVKSRRTPNCDVEIGHRSTTFSLLANISLATRSRLEWDAENEKITNNAEANDMLHYEYRKPWKLG